MIACASLAQNSLSFSTNSGKTLERLDSFIGVSKSVKGRRTAEEAVNNILYNMPDKKETVKRHTLSVLVDNEPGVLSKISGLLSARGFNIDSLTVSRTDVKELSRMTIVLKGPDSQLEQAGRQLEDLCDVWAVVDYRGTSVLERELVILKISCHPPGHDSELDQEQIAPYDKLMQAHFHRQAVLDVAKMFGANVNDIGSDSIILEFVSWSKRVDAMVRMLEPFGIIEAARSGVIAMARSQVAGELAEDDAREAVDLSSLPPS